MKRAAVGTVAAVSILAVGYGPPRPEGDEPLGYKTLDRAGAQQ